MSNQSRNLHNLTKYFVSLCKLRASYILLRLLDRVYQFWYYLEQIADNPIICDFENGSIGIFIDRDDRARTLHSHQVLDRTGDADRHIHLRSDGLSRAPHLALHRKPTGIADRTRSR